MSRLMLRKSGSKRVLTTYVVTKELGRVQQNRQGNLCWPVLLEKSSLMDRFGFHLPLDSSPPGFHSGGVIPARSAPLVASSQSDAGVFVRPSIDPSALELLMPSLGLTRGPRLESHDDEVPTEDVWFFLGCEGLETEEQCVVLRDRGLSLLECYRVDMERVVEKDDKSLFSDERLIRNVAKKAPSFESEFKRMKLSVAAAEKNASVILQTIPYDVTLIVFDYIPETGKYRCPEHSDDNCGWSVFGDDPLRYFGYFERDWTRKIYLLFRAIHLETESLPSAVPWRHIRFLNWDGSRDEKVSPHLAFQNTPQLDRLVLDMLFLHVADPDASLAFSAIRKLKYLVDLDIRVADAMPSLDASALIALGDEFTRRHQRGSRSLRRLSIMLGEFSDSDTLQMPSSSSSLFRCATKKLRLGDFTFAWRAGDDIEPLINVQTLHLVACRVSYEFLRYIRDNFRGKRFKLRRPEFLGISGVETLLPPNDSFFQNSARWSVQYYWPEHPVENAVHLTHCRRILGISLIGLKAPQFRAERVIETLNRLSRPFDLLLNFNQDVLVPPLLKNLASSSLRNIQLETVDPEICELQPERRAFFVRLFQKNPNLSAIWCTQRQELGYVNDSIDLKECVHERESFSEDLKAKEGEES